MKRILLIILFLGLGGCASRPVYLKPVSPLRQNMPGIYHRVEAGQTLWRISKIYNVDLDDIIRLNQLANSAKIEPGQMIFIPNRSKPQDYAVKYTNDDFIWPLKGRVVSLFGSNYHSLLNKGINIAGQSSSEVMATRSGKVFFCSWNMGNFSKTIIIDHGDGLRSVYARNSRLYVKAGDYVQKGALIARAGSTQRDKNIYLHFEIRRGSSPQNPLFYLP